ncbi:rubredoxin reductase [Gordonia sp. C13]|uniref:rubredoxin reductase n=1 Tax=Gordonia sp. C13 TaxID=2935078 RepID=UPI00200B962B|nr:rubredoxin reductase [Gordonia sp. C13]MCK8615735.1 rubredoxin reductase [Gordonia sp. C13]
MPGPATVRPGEPTGAGQWPTTTEHGKLVAMTIATDLGLAPGPATPLPRVPLAWSMQHSRNIQMNGWPATAAHFDVDVDAGIAVDAGGGSALRAEIESARVPVGAAG